MARLEAGVGPVSPFGRDKRSTESKAEKAEAAAKRAEELAERARQAAEEAKAAAQEAEDSVEEITEESEEEPEAVPAAAIEDEESEESEDDQAPVAVSLAKDEDEVVDDEVVVEDEPVVVKRRPLSRTLAGLGVVAGVLILVNLVLAGFMAWLFVSNAQADQIKDARKQATFAATQAAQDLSSYDYRTLDSDFRRAAGHTTGPFRTQFETESARVKSNAQQQQIVVEGTAIKTGIEEASEKKAVALVFLNQQTVKTSSAQRLPSQFTLRLSMTKVGERWLVEKLQVL